MNSEKKVGAELAIEILSNIYEEASLKDSEREQEIASVTYELLKGLLEKSPEKIN